MSRPYGARLMLVLLFAVPLVAACAGVGSPGPTPARGARVEPQALQLVQAGIPRPLPTIVPIAGDLSASLEVIDRPTAYERQLEVRLFRDDDPSAARDGAVLSAHNEMMLMDHGTFEAAAEELGGGRYLLTLPFTMAGEWQIELDITAQGESATLVLALDVLD